MSEKIKLKKYKEVLIKTLFKKESGKVNNDGSYFPKNEIVFDLVSYSGEYEDKKEKKAVPYEGKKIKITNYTLTMENGTTVRKKKIIKGVYGDYIVDEKKETHMSVEEYKDFLNYAFDDGLKDLENLED